MKKCIIIGTVINIILYIGIIVHASVTWQTANQFSVAWDVVTTNVDGNPLGANDIVKYEVFVVNSLTDPGKTNPSSIGITDQINYTLTLNTEGSFVIGVKSLRYIIDGETETLVSESAISWSDDPSVGSEFGVRYFLPPAKVTGMRPSN